MIVALLVLCVKCNLNCFAVGFFFLMMRRPPSSKLFPYTTLFRSRRLIQDICAEQVDIVVLLTGVGTQALVETAASMGLEQDFLRSLNTRTIIARSPKPARVLRRHKIHIDVMPPEPYTSQDLIQAIQDMDLSGKEVAVQAYGSPNSFLSRSLQESGANVREVTLYTDRKSTRLNSSHKPISYAVFCLKKKKHNT